MNFNRDMAYLRQVETSIWPWEKALLAKGLFPGGLKLFFWESGPEKWA